MVLSFLQQKQKTSFYSDFYPVWNLGALLLEFFHLYGTSFNYYHTGISLRGDGKYFPKYTFNQDKYHDIAINGLMNTGNSKNGKNRKRKFEEVDNTNNNTPNGNNRDRPGLFCVENPDVPDQDVGKNSYQMSKIRRSFEHAFQLLTVALNDSKQLSFLCYVIRANDSMFENRKISV